MYKFCSVVQLCSCPEMKMSSVPVADDLLVAPAVAKPNVICHGLKCLFYGLSFQNVHQR
jgi:hypothetical protein